MDPLVLFMDQAEQLPIRTQHPSTLAKTSKMQALNSSMSMAAAHGAMLSQLMPEMPMAIQLPSF
ncbi:MAG: hypothetical protein QNK92_02985 [Amylibacter sp.]